MELYAYKSLTSLSISHSILQDCLVITGAVSGAVGLCPSLQMPSLFPIPLKKYCSFSPEILTSVHSPGDCGMVGTVEVLLVLTWVSEERGGA